MKINVTETLRNPAKTLDGLVAAGIAHTLATFAFVDLTSEELAYVEAENHAAAIRYREEFRVVLRDRFRARGYFLADDWGKDQRRHLYLVADADAVRPSSGHSEKLEKGET